MMAVFFFIAHEKGFTFPKLAHILLFPKLAHILLGEQSF